MLAYRAIYFLAPLLIALAVYLVLEFDADATVHDVPHGTSAQEASARLRNPRARSLRRRRLACASSTPIFFRIATIATLTWKLLAASAARAASSVAPVARMVRLTARRSSLALVAADRPSGCVDLEPHMIALDKV